MIAMRNADPLRLGMSGFSLFMTGPVSPRETFESVSIFDDRGETHILTHSVAYTAPHV